MADDVKNDDATKAAEEAAREVAQAGELALDALSKALRHFSPARKLGAAFARLGQVFTENGFRRLANGMGLLGDGLFVLVVLLVAIVSVGAAIKFKQWFFLLKGLGLVLLLLAVQYMASRFLELNDRYIKLWSTRIGTPTLPGALAWLASVGGLLFLVAQLRDVINFDVWQPFWLGLAVWVGANFLAWSLLHPGLANVTVEQDTRGAAEALDILSYLAKQSLRLVSMVFGFAVLGGVVWLIGSMIDLFKNGIEDAHLAPVGFLIWVGILPLLSYVGIVFVRYNIGLGEAILSLLGKGEKR